MKKRKSQGIIICKQCEQEFEAFHFAAKFCKDGCRNKYNMKREYLDTKNKNRNEKRRRENEQKNKEKELQANIKKLKNKLSKLGKHIETLEIKCTKIKNCNTCGKEYIKGLTKHCSKECKPQQTKKKSISRDKRWSLNGKADYSITLEKLAFRDDNICHICNGKVDWNNYYIDEQGTTICGNDYPSIDHVLAIKNGGLHQWDNVKLAHRSCNSRKQAKLNWK